MGIAPVCTTGQLERRRRPTDASVLFGILQTVWQLAALDSLRANPLGRQLDGRLRRLPLPGAKDAWLVTYVAQVPKNGKKAPHPAEVILGTVKVTKSVGAKKS